MDQTENFPGEPIQRKQQITYSVNTGETEKKREKTI
jgi:hypothetical protein